MIKVAHCATCITTNICGSFVQRTGMAQTMKEITEETKIKEMEVMAEMVGATVTATTTTTVSVTIIPHRGNRNNNNNS